VVRERLNFPDATVEAQGWGSSDGAFRIHATRSIAIAQRATLPMHGRYLFHEGFVTAGMALAAAADRGAVADAAQ
jgi:hypothetical protein